VTKHRTQFLNDLAGEFARVAAEDETARTRRPSLMGAGPGRRTLAIMSAIVVLASGGAYAVPTTRAAIDDLTGAFAGWVAGEDDEAPGRALRPEDDAPAWVREQGGRRIAETDGVGLYVTRHRLPSGETLLNFALDEGVGIGATIEGWRERFDQHAVVVLGPTPVAQGELFDERGRFPLLGVTARSVDRVELEYADGGTLGGAGVNGGFVLMVDGRRTLERIVSYDADGRRLESVDVSHIDMRGRCLDQVGCAPDPGTP
jgi:hypothetical protein